MISGYRVGRGFTIVELLIVIVVIAILAAISMVAYNGIQDRAARSAMDSASAQAMKRIRLSVIASDGVYPDSITDCPSPTNANICLNEPGVSYRYRSLETAAAAGYAGSLAAPAYEVFTGNDKAFTYESTAEIRGGNEFVQYMDMAPIIDQYGLRKYRISFDVKSDTPGQISMYMQNGNSSKYIFSANLAVNTEFSHHSVDLTPTKNASGSSETKSILAFYGGYGSGRIPTIKNLRVSLAP